ncbi:MAG: PxxKW family cysteine-rich protein [Syntrophaceae bacterium]|nr:PxxKW family cysteine-rich protein [Syntrophaceae bacterium]
MLCQTVKEGVECTFMSKNGCTFIGGSCKTIIESCVGCNKVVEYPTGQYCKVYADPASRWTTGKCAIASHVSRDIKETTQKINPLKASKRASKGGKGGKKK